MIRNHRPTWIHIVVFSHLLAAALALTPPAAPAEAQEEGYVCPPCGCSEDNKVMEQAGSCTACRMKLIRKSELQRVAILLYDGVSIMDSTAPWEVFGTAGFDVFTVSKTGAAVTTAMGMSVNPKHSFENSPEPTILLVPGGRRADDLAEDPAVRDWVGRTAARARHVLSVSNGAFVLARAGLLDGQKATTFSYMLDQLQMAAPGIQVASEERVVDGGKVITAGGSSSALDMALHVVSRIRGLAAAQRIALHLEYDWRPESRFARAALAERYMPRLTGPDWEGVEMVSTSGDRERWEARYRMKGSAPAPDLLKRVKTVLENMRGWKSPSTAPGAASAEGSWTFLDDAGLPWTGTARIEKVDGEDGIWSVSVSVAKDRPSAG